MQFIILNRDQMKDYKCDKEHLIISIKDPDTSDIEIAERQNCIGILRLSFHDFDDLSLDYPGRIKLISKEDAKEILTYVYNKLYHCPIKVDVIICQCEAGISRSAGVAGALSKIINGDDKAIFSRYLPNMLVYRTILNSAYEQGMYENYEVIIALRDKHLEYIIDKALAKANNTENLIGKSYSLFGNKKKYIKAILEALKNE